MSKIYFAEAGDGGPIKIGFTKDSFEARRSGIQGGCPYPIKLLAIVPGTVGNERWLHRKFAAIRLEGEWFNPSQELREFITHATSGTFSWPSPIELFDPSNKMLAAFVEEIDAFMNQSRMTATAFGRVAVNDPNFVGDIRNGRMPNLRQVDRVQHFIRSQQSSAA